jgi:hypothetical protein
MEKDSQSARQQDTNKMKHGIRDFFANNHQAGGLPPIPRDKRFNLSLQHVSVPTRAYMHSIRTRSKSFRFARFMLIFWFRYIERITSEVTADQFPNFMYDESEAEELFGENPEKWDAEKSLSRLPMCLWVSFLVLFVSYLHQFVDTVVRMHLHG